MNKYLKCTGIALIIFAPFCAYQPANQISITSSELTAANEAQRLQIAVERRLAKMEQEAMQTKKVPHAQRIRVMEPLEMLEK